MSKTIKIPGRLESAETGKVVAGANAILDDTKGKKQNVINEETDAELLRLDQEKQGNLTFDQTPTEDSTNPVTSGGVYAADQMLSQVIEAILLLIPSAASELNKLVDLATMNSSISTATASFKGTYNLVSDLHLTVSATHAQIAAALDALSLGADNNDYAFVQVPNTDTAPTDIAKTERYKFNGENWAYEYDLNNSGFTTAQWNAINSGITTLLVAKLSALPTNEALTLALAGKQDNLTFDNVPTAGSNNPVKSSGIYTRNNEIVELINALDVAKQNVLTFDTTPTNGSTNPVTSNGVYLAIQLVQTAVVALDGRMGTAETKISTAEGNIVNLQAAYAALTQSDIVVVSGALPSSGQQQNIIYRQPDQDHTPPQFYSDYMWNGTAWVLMATYNNAIDEEPTAGSDNLVKSGGVARDMELMLQKVHSVNLFNKDSDNLFNGYVGANGYTSANNYRATHPIFVIANTTYKAKHSESYGNNNYVAICSEDGDFIYAIEGVVENGFITFSVENDCYVRLNITNVVSNPNYLDSYMVCKESEYPVEYVSYRIEPEKDCGLNQKMKNEAKSMIDEASSEILSEAALKDVSVNLFNKYSDNLLLGYIASDAEYVFNDNYRATHPIFVKSNTLYKAGYNADTFGTNNRIAICTEDGTLINVIQGSVSDGYITFTVNADCYVRLNICKVLAFPSYIDTFMVCKASEYPSEYVNYHSTIDNNLGLNSIMKSDVEKEVYSTSIYGTKIQSPNLYDFNNPLGIDGYYSIDGTITYSANHRITHPIKVKAGQKYKATFNTETLVTSNNKVLIVSADNTQVLGLIDGIIDTNANTITFSSDSDCFVALNIGIKILASYYQYMICKNEEFPSSFMPYNTSYALNGNIKSRLRGKSVIFTGDSICEGVSDSYGGGWARRIGEKNEMVWLNKGVGGGTIIDKTLVGSSFTISDTDFMNGADYIIFEGGTNDADRIGSILDPNNIPALFGTWSASDYSSNFNNQTFCSAFEKLIKGVVSSFPTTKTGYIVAPKMTRLGSGYAPDYSAEHNNRRAYFEVAIEICKKWGVPVLNLWDNCSMNPMIPSHYSGTNPDENGLYYDGQHPTSKGYDFITPLIESWMESL